MSNGGHPMQARSPLIPHEKLVEAAPLLVELAVKVSGEYEDAADWKDAFGSLQSLAREALEKLK